VNRRPRRVLHAWLACTAAFTLLGPGTASAEGGGSATGDAAKGKALAIARDKGNCLACHAIEDGELPGNLGPPLFAMKARFPDPDTIREQIRDATVRNPDSRMPPFGRHGILTDDEIDLIVTYLYTL